MSKKEEDSFQKAFDKLVAGILFGIGVLFIIAFIVLLTFGLGSASAAENSAPLAPATSAENAIIVKGYTSCPTEFNPDDSAWALDRIESAEKKIADDLLVVEHIRVFSHMRLSKCAARLYSYGSLDDSDGKRVFALMKSPIGITALLLTEKGWESGDDIETFITDCTEAGCNLAFALYRNKESVAARTIFIRQFSHFREPVE